MHKILLYNCCKDYKIFDIVKPQGEKHKLTDLMQFFIYMYIVVNSLMLHDCSCMPAYLLRMVDNIQGSTEFYIALDTAYKATHT